MLLLCLTLLFALPALADPSADAYRRGYVCLASNRYSEAAAFFKTAADSTNAATAAAAWLGRGEAFYGAKQWDAAIAAYDTLLKAAPNSPHAARALYARGFAEFRSGRLPQALATFTVFKKSYPKHALAATAAASAEAISRTLAAQTKQREAEAMVRDLTAINALSRGGKPAEAATAARAFLQAHPNHPQAAELRYLSAAGALQAKDYAHAVDAYRDFLAHHPRHAQAAGARLEIGHALYALGRYGEAADAYAAAGQPRAAILQADSLFKARRYAEALPLLETLIRSAADAKEKAQATLTAGDCYTALKNWKKAEQAFLDVELFCGDAALRPVALARLADLYDKKGLPELAACTRKELERRFPDRK